MTMADGDTAGDARARCQARPVAARRGFREDVLCASYANTQVRFREVDVPVCRIHEATYERWACDADENASTLWAWGSEAGVPLRATTGPGALVTSS
jgi:hypothetical protein